MNFKEVVLTNRSYRRFAQDRRISLATLEGLVDLARQTACTANKQPLQYALVASEEMTATIFPLLGWAGYLTHWKGPEEGERPAAYIVILGNDAIATEPQIDLGIAAQTIMLGATAQGLGGCMLASVNREKVHEALRLPEGSRVLLVLALGTPVEKVYLEPLGEEGNIKYWRDAEGGHHVPKRGLEDVIIARS